MSRHVSFRTLCGFRQVHVPSQGKPEEKQLWSLSGNGFRGEANHVS